MAKVYLGDSVYADIEDGFSIILTTENGYAASNTIILEPQTLAALVAYVKHVTAPKPRASPARSKQRKGKR